MRPAPRIVQCPHCQTIMGYVEAERGLFVDFCQGCGRTWLDQGELGRILGRPQDLPDTARPHPSPTASLACPACKTASLLPWTLNSLEFERCSQCLGTLIKLREARQFRSLYKPAFTSPNPDPRQDPPIQTHVSTLDTPRLDLVAVPIALVIGLGLGQIRLIMYLAWYVSMIFHELGHGVAAWLSGYLAIPVPFGFTFYSGNQSYVVIAGFVACWCRGLIAAFNAKSTALGVFFLVLLGAQIYLSFGLEHDRAREMFVAGGFVGELIFGALLISAFHARLPWRWDFWRFPALFVGMLVYSQSIVRWIKVKVSLAEIPWGSVVGDTSDGDLSRLRDRYLWTESTIVDFYYHVAMASLAWILVHYVLSLPATLRRIQRSRP